MRADDFVTGDSARGAGQSSLIGTETTNAVNSGLVSSAVTAAKNMVIGGTELGDVDKVYQGSKTAAKGAIGTVRVGSDLVKDTVDTARNTARAVKAGLNGKDLDLSNVKSRSAGNLQNGLKKAGKFAYREGKHALIKDSELEDIDSLYQEVKGTAKAGIGAAKKTAKGTVKAVKTTAKGVRKTGSTIKTLASKRNVAKKMTAQTYRNMQRAVYKTAQAARSAASALGRAAQAAAAAAKSFAIAAAQAALAALEALAAFFATPVGIVVLVVFMMLFLFIGVSNNTSVGDLTGTEATVAKFLKGKGLDNTHVAAIMGNMYAESGMDPSNAEKKSNVNDPNYGIGLCQWTYGRHTNLQSYAKSVGKSWTDVGVQLDFFWDHDKWQSDWGSSYSIYPGDGPDGSDERSLDPAVGTSVAGHKSKFMSTDDLKDAVRQFCYGWEVAGVPRLKVRYEAAERYYKALKASENSGDGDHGNGKGAPQIKGATARQQAVVNACYSTPSPGLNWCAAWVTNVFRNAGVGYFGGNACDMFNAYCHSSDRNTLKVGMIVADSSHFGTGTPGLQYGNVGIYVGNNKVMSNEGAITTKSLQDFINFYGTGSGVKWGWIGGIDLSK